MEDDISTTSLPLGAQSQLNHDDDGEETQHFQQVIQSYQQYATFHQTRQRGVHRRLENLLRLETNNVTIHNQYPSVHSILPPSLLPGYTNSSSSCTQSEYLTNQKEFSDATIRNQFFLDNVLKYSNQETSQDVLRRLRTSNRGQHPYYNHQWSTEDRISKIDSVLKSLARDWSIEGQKERSLVYDRMIGALMRYLPLRSLSENSMEQPETDSTSTAILPYRIAVPGSGLGRLAWEIYSRGYSVQGSDFSLPMLLASDFVLNGCGNSRYDKETEGTGDGGTSFQQYTISPWLAETKNVVSFRDRIRTVTVPDVDPTAIDHTETNNRFDIPPEFTMLAGEFLQLYSHHLPANENKVHNASHQEHLDSIEKFHAVVCSFFLDTAPSIPHYLLTIYHMLQNGGLFIHCGPLMYHWSGHGSLLPGDDNDEVSVKNTNGSDNNDFSSTAYQERNKHLDSRYLTSVDYTWEEVRYMIGQCGFDILEEEMQIPAYYTLNERSMMKTGYECVFCVARKKILK